MNHSIPSQQHTETPSRLLHTLRLLLTLILLAGGAGQAWGIEITEKFDVAQHVTVSETTITTINPISGLELIKFGPVTTGTVTLENVNYEGFTKRLYISARPTYNGSVFVYDNQKAPNGNAVMTIKARYSGKIKIYSYIQNNRTLYITNGSSTVYSYENTTGLNQNLQTDLIPLTAGTTYYVYVGGDAPARICGFTYTYDRTEWIFNDTNYWSSVNTTFSSKSFIDNSGPDSQGYRYNNTISNATLYFDGNSNSSSAAGSFPIPETNGLTFTTENKARLAFNANVPYLAYSANTKVHIPVSEYQKVVIGVYSYQHKDNALLIQNATLYDGTSTFAALESRESREITLYAAKDATTINVGSSTNWQYINYIKLYGTPPTITGSMTYASNKVDKGEVTAVPTFFITASDGSTLTTADYDITYTSSDDTKATVASDGKVTGVGVGAVTITATLTPKNPRKCYGTEFTFDMTATAKGVHFITDPKECYLKVGDNYTLVDKVQKIEIDGDITYSSDNVGVATVNETTGVVTAVAAGDAVITATAGGHSDTYTVHVVDFHFNESSGTLINQNGGETLDVSLTNSTGESLTSVGSSPEGVATATATDATHIRLTAVGGGTATITASITDYHGLSLSDTYEVTVKNFYFTTATKAMKLDGSLNVGDLLNNTTGQTPSYSSGKAAVATVDNEGNITVEGEGSATITASVTIDGTTYSTTFTLYVVDFGFTTASGILPLDDLPHTKVLTLTNETEAKPTFSSNTPSVATVSSDGNTVTITPVSEGTATITATINYMGADIATDYTVTVSTFRYTSPSANISVGDKVTTVSLTNSTGVTPTYSSSNPAVAGVTTDGTVVGLSAGTATITATITVDGQEYTTSYTVTATGLPTPATITKKWDFTNYDASVLEGADEAYWGNPQESGRGDKRYRKIADGVYAPIYKSEGQALELTPEFSLLKFYTSGGTNETSRYIQIGGKDSKSNYIFISYAGIRIPQEVLTDNAVIKLTVSTWKGGTNGTLTLTNATYDNEEDNSKVPVGRTGDGAVYTIIPTDVNNDVDIYFTGGMWQVYKIEVTDAKQFGTATLTYDKTSLSEEHNVATKTGLSVVKYGTEEAIDLSIYDVTYVSSNPSIATVDAEGKVTAFAPGSVTITAVLTPKEAYAADYYPVLGTATINVNVSDEFVWVKNGTTVMASDEEIEVSLTDVDWNNQIAGLPTINMGTATGTVTYSSSVPSVAGYYGSETTLRMKSPGNTVITATAESRETATYKLVVTADNVTGNSAGDDGRYTFEETGVLATTKGSITHSGVTMTFGHEGETALVVPDAVVGTALKIIDANGYSHANTESDRELPPDGQLGGTYVTFQSGVNGVLTVVGHFDNPTFYDATVGTDATKTIDGNILTATLEGNHLYYLYNGAPGAHNPTPLVHAFGYSIAEEIDFSKFQWLANNASSNRRLDRTIPRWNVKFNGGRLKYENAEYRENYHGSISFQDNSDSGNETITLSPRLLAGAEGGVLITGIEIYVNKASEIGSGRAKTGSPQVSVNDGTPVDVTEGWMTIPMSEPSASAVIKRVTTGSGNRFNVSGVRVAYTVTGGKTVAEVLNTTKLGPTVYLKDSRGDGAAIRPYVQIKTPDGSDAGTYQWTYNPVDPLNTEKDKFKSGVFTYTSSNPSVATVSVGTTLVHKDKTYADGTTMEEYRNGKDDGTNWYYQPTITMVHPLSYGYAYVVASYAGNDYFAATEKKLRVYGYDYEEPMTLVLKPGESYKTPSTAGQQFELTAFASTDDFKVAVTGVTGGDVEDGKLTFGTASSTQKASVSGNEIVITNPAESEEELTITLVKVSRIRPTLRLSYDTVGDDMAFIDETLTPTYTILDEDGNDLSSHYTTHTPEFAISKKVNTSSTINVSTGIMEAGNTIGRTTVALMLQPDDAITYAPIGDEIEIMVLPHEWDLTRFTDRDAGKLSTWNANTYRREHTTDDYAYIESTDAIGSLDYTFGLQTKGYIRYYYQTGSWRMELVNSYQSALAIPVRRGMVLELYLKANDRLDVPVTFENAEPLFDNDMEGEFLIGDTYETYKFLVQSDGYVYVENDNGASAVYPQIRKINLTDEIVFNYDNETYVDVNEEDFQNEILNPGGSQFTYAVTEGETYVRNGASGIDSGTGVIGAFTDWGDVTVTATADPNGLHKNEEVSYLLHVVGMNVINTESADKNGDGVDDYYSVHGTLHDGKLTIDDLAQYIQILDAEYSDPAGEGNTELRKLVVFSCTNVSKKSSTASVSVSLDSIYSIVFSGSGTYEVTATLGAITRTIDFIITGPEFVDMIPVVPNTHSSYIFEMEATVNEVDYNTITYEIDWAHVRGTDVNGNAISGFTAESHGSLNGAIVAETGNKKFEITGIAATMKGGIIPVIARCDYSSDTDKAWGVDGKISEDETVVGVLTVAYNEHDWDFITDGNMNISSWGGYNEDVSQKANNETLTQWYIINDPSVFNFAISTLEDGDYSINPKKFVKGDITIETNGKIAGDILTLRDGAYLRVWTTYAQRGVGRVEAEGSYINNLAAQKKEDIGFGRVSGDSEPAEGESSSFGKGSKMSWAGYVPEGNYVEFREKTGDYETYITNLHVVEAWKVNESNYDWVLRKHNDKYEGRGQDDRPETYAYHNVLVGTNGLLVEETAGLVIEANYNQFGIRYEPGTTVEDENLKGTFPTMTKGCKYIIPKVKPGQWIDIYWSRYQEGMGQRFKLTNLVDVHGKPITDVLHIGSTGDDAKQGSYSLQVNPDAVTDADGFCDVSIECVDKAWCRLHRIQLHDRQDYVSTMYDKIQERPEDNDGGKKDGTYIYNDGAEHKVSYAHNLFQNAPNAPFKYFAVFDASLQGTSYNERIWSSTRATYTDPQITFNGGWGKFYLTLESYSNEGKNRYCVSRRTWTFTVAKQPKQNYPYTWDFTRYFGETRTVLSDDEDISNEDNPATETFDESTPNTKSWSMADDSDMADLSTDKYGAWNYQSYYVDGGQLVSSQFADSETDGSVPELEGLGFNINGGSGGSISLNLVSATVEKPAGGKRRAKRKAPRTIDGEGELSISGTGTIIVPKPEGEDFRTSESKYYIYVVADKKPSVVEGKLNEVTDDMYGGETLPDGKKKYVFEILTDENQRLTFTDAKVGMIGVTNIFRTMHKVGDTAWATWSHRHDIDHALTGYFTTNDADAYTVGYDSYDLHTATVELTPVEEDGYVPATHGVVLRQDINLPGVDPYEVPLFHPAVTTVTPSSTATAFSASGNLMMANPEQRVLRSERETGVFDGNADANDDSAADDGDYTRFMLTNVYWTYNKEINAAGYVETKTWKTQKDKELTYAGQKYTNETAAGFYRLHIWDTDAQNTLAANSAYLLVPTDKLPTAIWADHVPKYGFWAKDRVFIRNSSAQSDRMDDDLPHGDEADDEADAASSARTDDAFYTLSGIRLQGRPTQPGIYIHRGRKVRM